MAPVRGKVAVIASSFNRPVVDALVQGALTAIAASGAELVGPVWVAGALELTLACEWVVEAAQPVAVVALGCVIRGETRHFELVCDNAVAGLQQVSLAHGVPVGQGVLACETLDQAMERSVEGSANSGYQAAEAALGMARLRLSVESTIGPFRRR
ncbi:MAG: 6,7-dimethyl-8-ribityllumazine synthase [Sulfobacillus sp.]